MNARLHSQELRPVTAQRLLLGIPMCVDLSQNSQQCRFNLHRED